MLWFKKKDEMNEREKMLEIALFYVKGLSMEDEEKFYCAVNLIRKSDKLKRELNGYFDIEELEEIENE